MEGPGRLIGVDSEQNSYFTDSVTNKRSANWDIVTNGQDQGHVQSGSKDRQGMSAEVNLGKKGRKQVC